MQCIAHNTASCSMAFITSTRLSLHGSWKLTMLYPKAHQRFCFTVFMVSLLNSNATSNCVEVRNWVIPRNIQGSAGKRMKEVISIAYIYHINKLIKKFPPISPSRNDYQEKGLLKSCVSHNVYYTPEEDWQLLSRNKFWNKQNETPVQTTNWTYTSMTPKTWNISHNCMKHDRINIKQWPKRGKISSVIGQWRTT